MIKKDFSQDSQDVFNSMFSRDTIKEAEKKEIVKPKQEEKKVEKKEEKIKSQNEKKTEKKEVEIKEEIETNTISPVKEVLKEKKSKRFNFYLENSLSEYFDNIKWIKRVDNSSDYINKLIREDFVKTLRISENSASDEIEKAWNKYKKENSL